MARMKSRRGWGRWFILSLLAAGFLWTPRGAAAANDGQSGGTPWRPVVTELTEFKLCELDRYSLAAKGPCIPAKVPGDVFTALMTAGKIPDPYKDLNSLPAQWVDDRAWKYETKFQATAKPGRRIHLWFMGVDYISKIELNGKVLVSKHEGMFSRMDLDITDQLKASGDQALAVTLFGIPGSDAIEKLGPYLGTTEFGRRKYLKTQMSFGWDFSPRLKGAGIWDRVYVYETGPIGIKDIFIQPHLDGKLDVSVELSGPAATDADLEVTITGETFLNEPIRAIVPIRKGESGEKKIAMTVPSPRLWWPWDMGAQDLYRATARILIGGEESARVGEVFGVREIKWGPNPSAPPGSADWVLFVNGQREFMRGANYVPAEAMYGRMEDTRYLSLISMAKDAGVNMVRVWGGGNRERRAFYDYCDRTGVMVWQEFPYACVFLIGYPRTRHFQDLSRQEVDEIVRQLRNHPSLMLWCGGNEFNVVQNQQVVDIMAELTAQLDPTRRFIPASPYKGDSHNWVVWHMKGNLSDYFADLSPVPSEFGLQAFPDVQTIMKWISEPYRWPIGKVYFHHDLGWDKEQKYLRPLGPADNLEAVVKNSQLMQAHYLQRGIEHWRQRKYQTSGTAFWQLNEPWPAVCWSVVDYELRPKLAYLILKDTYNPVLVSAAFADQGWKPGDNFEAEIIVVNDLHKEYKGAEVTAELCSGASGKWTLDVPEDGVASAGKIKAAIPAECKLPYLTLSLRYNGQEISKNRYELWVYDPVPAGSTNRNLEKIGKFIMSGAKQTQWEEDKKSSP